MMEFVNTSIFFGLALTLGAYWLGLKLYMRYRFPLLNPMLTSSLLIMAVLALSGISFAQYNMGARYISLFLTPATIALAVPAYKELQNIKACRTSLFASIAIGAASSMILVLVAVELFGLTDAVTKSILAKSATGAIAQGLAYEAGGLPSLAVAVSFLTGVFGAIMAESVLKVCRVKSPIARGIAIGTSAHVAGTAKAFELGQTEGAFSSVSIVLAGLAAVVFMPLALMIIG